MPERRIADRLPTNPGPAAWNELLPAPPPPRRLEHNINADWLVIGGGWAGLAAARRLSQLRPGERIVVLEALRLGQGPAGRNSGFMIDLPHNISGADYSGAIEADRQQTRMNRVAIAFNAEAAQEYGLSDEAFSPAGKINAAASEAGVARNTAYARHLTELGEEPAWLDAAAMRDLTGLDFYRSGVFTQGAAMVQPAMFIRGVAAGLEPVVEIYEQSAVVSMTRRVTDWRVETLKGAVTAPKVILAVNGHAESFGYFQRRLMHVFTYASMTRSLSADEIKCLGGQPRWALLPADPMGTTVRRTSGTGGDRIVVRNRFTYDPGMEVSEQRLAAVARDHDVSFSTRFPMLGGVGMEYRWGGRLCLSWNGVPAFGEIEEGMFSACCQNGLGTSKGTLAGMLAAEHATRSNSPLVDEMLAFAKPRLLPPEPLAWIGANATMRWKEWKAGREM